ncbi:hypothetical protein M271_50685 [Streptomyces rapamycinicus NRRL 5491]|nr:hypothetical protein M271_50685 [Streptomyces rapamycinicus NRRL 5491]
MGPALFRVLVGLGDGGDWCRHGTGAVVLGTGCLLEVRGGGGWGGERGRCSRGEVREHDAHLPQFGAQLGDDVVDGGVERFSVGVQPVVDVAEVRAHSAQLVDR